MVKSKQHHLYYCTNHMFGDSPFELTALSVLFVKNATNFSFIPFLLSFFKKVYINYCHRNKLTTRYINKHKINIYNIVCYVNKVGCSARWLNYYIYIE